MRGFYWTVLAVVLAVSSQTSKVEAQTSSARASSGGWATASPGESALSEAKLKALDTDVRAGKFVKIGSVLVARHGKLVYEGYFDGDASLLRDTRSATKSITDVLFGIAIDERKLSGLDSRV